MKFIEAHEISVFMGVEVPDAQEEYLTVIAYNVVSTTGFLLRCVNDLIFFKHRDISRDKLIELLNKCYNCEKTYEFYQVILSYLKAEHRSWVQSEVWLLLWILPEINQYMYGAWDEISCQVKTQNFSGHAAKSFELDFDLCNKDQDAFVPEQLID